MDISFHFEGVLFAAAGAVTILLALVLAVGAAIGRSRAAAASGVAAPGRVSDHLPALACLLVGAGAVVGAFSGRPDTAGWAQRATLDGVFWLVPAMGLALWALARSVARPPKPRAVAKKKA